MTAFGTFTYIRSCHPCVIPSVRPFPLFFPPLPPFPLPSFTPPSLPSPPPPQQAKEREEYESWVSYLRQHRLYRQNEIAYGSKDAPRLTTDLSTTASSPLTPNSAVDALCNGFDDVDGGGGGRGGGGDAEGERVERISELTAFESPIMVNEAIALWYKTRSF